MTSSIASIGYYKSITQSRPYTEEDWTDPDAAGERFICSGKFCWFEDLGGFLREAYPDKRTPTRRMPNWLVSMIGLFNQGLRSNQADLDRTQIVAHDKITRILVLTLRSAKEATLATAEGLIKLGVVPK